jgi:shikimate dehydrogenase
MALTAHTQLLGVLGDPIHHSLSPTMHNAALAELGLDYVYLAWRVAAADLATAVAGLRAIGVRGFSVTIPHKQAIMPLLAEITPEAAAIGAVNTVWATPQGWAGTNTDVAGFIAPLAGGRDWSGARALVLGNGGAARAAIAGCAHLGFGAIAVVGRQATKLATLQADWAKSPQPPPLTVHAWEDLPQCLAAVDLVVNTTPLGMGALAAESPLSGFELAQLPDQATVYDLIYNPRPTRLLQLAAARGLTPLDGLEMLVQQGAAALSIWLGQPAPVDTMRSALVNWLETH